MIKLEQGLVHENSKSPDALKVKKPKSRSNIFEIACRYHIIDSHPFFQAEIAASKYNITYGVIVQNEGVLVLVEVVKGALGDSVLDLDGAFDVLLLRELNFIVVDALRLVPLSWRRAMDRTIF